MRRHLRRRGSLCAWRWAGRDSASGCREYDISAAAWLPCSFPGMKSRAHAPNGRDRASVAGKQPPIDEATDLLIVGAGPAGIAAALTAASGGVRVTLVDENPVPLQTMGEDVPLHFGGRMAPTVANRNAVLESILRARPELAEAIDGGVDVRLGTAAWGLFPHRRTAGWI